MDQLVTARLVTSDAGVVEIAHESLVSAWPRLRAWLDEDVEGRRVLHHLVATADAWDTLGRPESELYRGVRLSATLAWRDAHQPELTDVERDFLAAGAAAAAAEERAAADRARQQSRMIRRLSVTAAGAACSSCSRSSRVLSRCVRPGRPRRPRPPPRPGEQEPWRSSPTTSTSRCCSPSRATGSTTLPRRGAACWLRLAGIQLSSRPPRWRVRPSVGST